jgi:hypothetical protein
MYPITPTPVRLGKDADSVLETYVKDNIRSIKDSLAVLHESKITKWRRLTRGERQTEKKNFPWPNASNLVVQIIGTCTDILKAAIMASIWDVLPIYHASLVGEWEEKELGEEQRSAVEEAMNYFSSEQEELDLYRVESLWFGEAISFGTSFVKAPFEKLMEVQMVSLDGTNTSVPKEITKKHGPTPVKLPFEDMGYDTKSSTLEECRFKYHIVKLSKYDLEERAFKGIYDRDAVKKIMGQYDTPTTDGAQQQRQQDQGVTETASPSNAEYWIYECWFPYFHNGKRYRMIYSYHFRSNTKMRAIYNFYPDNEEPFRMARLGYDDDGLLGYGYAEMLEHYQEEIATKHNQRNDAGTLRNTSIARVSRASKLDSIFSLYPGAVVPGEQNEIEIMNLGTATESTVPEEQMSLQLAERRAGIDMGIQASGGGTQNPRKGVYSAMGTFSVMQQSNKRSNLRTTDMRYSHISLGRLVLKLYATFGLGDKGRIFGKNEKYLVKALEAVKSGRLNFPVRASTASINRELEKQNDMLLVNVLRQHHMGIAQLMQSVVGGQLPPPLAKYLVKTIRSSDALMHQVLRNFGHDDTSRLLPDNDLVKALNEFEKSLPTEEEIERSKSYGSTGSDSTRNAGEGGGIAGNNGIPTVSSAQTTSSEFMPTSGAQGVPVVSNGAR